MLLCIQLYFILSWRQAEQRYFIPLFDGFFLCESYTSKYCLEGRPSIKNGAMLFGSTEDIFTSTSSLGMGRKLLIVDTTIAMCDHFWRAPKGLFGITVIIAFMKNLNQVEQLSAFSLKINEPMPFWEIRMSDNNIVL